MAAAVFGKNCKGCAHIKKETDSAGETWHRCFAEGPCRGYVMSDGAGNFFPWVPAWCPQKEVKTYS